MRGVAQVRCCFLIDDKAAFAGSRVRISVGRRRYSIRNARVKVGHLPFPEHEMRSAGWTRFKLLFPVDEIFKGRGCWLARDFSRAEIALDQRSDDDLGRPTIHDHMAKAQHYGH